MLGNWYRVIGEDRVRKARHIENGATVKKSNILMHGITLWIGVGTERRYFCSRKINGVYWTVLKKRIFFVEGSDWRPIGLMSNHYHLLVQTPEANLSRYMRHYLTAFTRNISNRTYKSDGQLFRGRYKSIVIDVTATFWSLWDIFTIIRWMPA